MSFLVSGYRYLGGGITDRHEILPDGRYGSRTGLLPFGGGGPQKSQILIADISKMVSCSVTCQLEALELKISSARDSMG